MKGFLRFFSIIIAALIIMTLFYGCKEKTISNTTSKISSSLQKQTTQKISGTMKTTLKSTTTSQTSGNETGEVDTNGENTDIEDINDEENNAGEESFTDEGPYAGLKYSLDEVDFKGQDILVGSIYWPGIATNPDEVKIKREKNAQEKFNFKLVDVPFNGNTVKNDLTTNLIAGIRTVDIITIGTQDAFPLFIKSKFLMPLNEYIDYNAEPWATYAETNRYVDGSNYSMSKSISGMRNLVFNRAIIEREGLTDPLDLARQENWTWETFLDMALKCTRDFNGDGINDQYGVGGTSLVNCIMHSNGAKIVTGNGKGGLSTSLNTPEAMRAFEFCQQLINIYKVTNNSFGSVVATRTHFNSGILAMTFDTEDSILYRAIPAGLLTFSYAPFPLGPDADGFRVTGTTSYMASIASNTIYDPKELIYAYLLMNYIDPDSPEAIDPYEEYKRKRMVLQPALTRESDVKFWYDFNNNMPKVVDYVGSFPTVDAAFNRNVAGEILNTSIITVIDKYKLMIETIFSDF